MCIIFNLSHNIVQTSYFRKTFDFVPTKVQFLRKLQNECTCIHYQHPYMPVISSTCIGCCSYGTMQGALYTHNKIKVLAIVHLCLQYTKCTRKT